MIEPFSGPGPESLWNSTANPAPQLTRLETDVRAEVAIVGAGYSGLSAAHALQKRGIRSVVLDANSVGWGASGRNGGVVTSKFRITFPEIARVYDLDTARRMHRIAHDAVHAVEELIAEFDIESAQFERTGNLRCAHTERSHAAISTEAEWLRRELGDGTLSLLSRAEVAEETGSQAFVGGVLISGSGTIHPLNYVRGIAAGLAARGVAIYEGSPVKRITRVADGLLIETPAGTVQARQAIIATDAYSDLTPATRYFQSTIIPFRSAIIATECLPADIGAKLMVRRRSYTETRRMMKWFRKVDNRVLIGGRGAFGKEDSPSGFHALQRDMISLFPDLAQVGISFKWSGFVGMTLGQLPHVGRLDDRICFCLGYNGAGVAMATLLGQYAAAFTVGETPDVGLLDAARLKSVPFYPLREPGVRLAAAWYQFLDRIGS